MKKQTYIEYLEFLTEQNSNNSLLEGIRRREKKTGVFLATKEDLPGVIKIYSDRTRWLKEKGKLYFHGRGVRHNYRNASIDNNLYVYKLNNEVLGFAIFKTQKDEIWDNFPDRKSLYLVDLFSALDNKGVTVAKDLFAGINTNAAQRGFESTRGSVVRKNQALIDHYMTINPDCKIIGTAIDKYGFHHTLIEYILDNRLNETVGDQTSNVSQKNLVDDAFKKSTKLVCQDKNAQFCMDMYAKYMLDKETMTISDAQEIDCFDFDIRKLDNSERTKIKESKESIKTFDEIEYFSNLTQLGPKNRFSSSFCFFKSFDSLERIKIPKSVKIINDDTFAYCVNLKEIVFQNDVVYEIKGSSGIRSTQWYKNLPDKQVMYFGKCAIEIKNDEYQTIDELIFDDETIWIDKELLSKENIKKLYIPKYYTNDSQKQEELLAFLSHAETIEELIVDDNPNYAADGPILYNKDKSEILFVTKTVKNETLKIISSVRNIDNLNIRRYKHLTEIIFEGDIEKIPNNFAEDCLALKKVILPKNLKTIEENAFLNCQLLEDIKIPSSVVEIKNGAFRKTGLKTIKFPENTVLGNFVFQSCEKLENVELPINLTEIGDRMFEDCHLKEFNFSKYKKLKKINRGAFAFNDFQTIDLSGCPIEELEACFCKCDKLTEVILPDSITTLIGTFKECKNLSKINLPSSLKKLREVPFGKTDIKLEFDELPSHITDYINEPGVHGQSYGYANGSNLKGFHLKEFHTDASFKKIDDRVYQGIKIDTLFVSEGTEVIESGAFKFCEISKVYLPKTLKLIEKESFGLAYKHRTSSKEFESRPEVFIPDTPSLIKMKPDAFGYEGRNAIFFVPEKRFKNYSESETYKKAFGYGADVRLESEKHYNSEPTTKDKQKLSSYPFKFVFGKREIHSDWYDMDWILTCYRREYISDVLSGKNAPDFEEYRKDWARKPSFNCYGYNFYRRVPVTEKEEYHRTISCPVFKKESEIRIDLLKSKKTKSDILNVVRNACSTSGMDGEKLDFKVFFFDDKEIDIDIAWYHLVKFSHDNYEKWMTDHTIFKLVFSGEPSPNFKDTIVDDLKKEFFKKHEKEDKKLLKEFMKDINKSLKVRMKILKKKEIERKLKQSVNETIQNQIDKTNSDLLKNISTPGFYEEIIKLAVEKIENIIQTGSKPFEKYYYNNSIFSLSYFPFDLDDMITYHPWDYRDDIEMSLFPKSQCVFYEKNGKRVFRDLFFDIQRKSIDVNFAIYLEPQKEEYSDYIEITGEPCEYFTLRNLYNENKKVFCEVISKILSFETDKGPKKSLNETIDNQIKSTDSNSLKLNGDKKILKEIIFDKLKQKIQEKGEYTTGRWSWENCFIKDDNIIQSIRKLGSGNYYTKDYWYPVSGSIFVSSKKPYFWNREYEDVEYVVAEGLYYFTEPHPDSLYVSFHSVHYSEDCIFSDKVDPVPEGYFCDRCVYINCELDTIFDEDIDLFYKLVNRVLPEMNLLKTYDNVNESIDNQINKTKRINFDKKSDEMILFDAPVNGFKDLLNRTKMYLDSKGFPEMDYKNEYTKTHKKCDEENIKFYFETGPGDDYGITLTPVLNNTLYYNNSIPIYTCHFQLYPIKDYKSFGISFSDTEMSGEFNYDFQYNKFVSLAPHATISTKFDSFSIIKNILDSIINNFHNLFDEILKDMKTLKSVFYGNLIRKQYMILFNKMSVLNETINNQISKTDSETIKQKSDIALKELIYDTLREKCRENCEKNTFECKEWDACFIQNLPDESIKTIERYFNYGRKSYLDYCYPIKDAVFWTSDSDDLVAWRIYWYPDKLNKGNAEFEIAFAHVSFHSDDKDVPEGYYCYEETIDDRWLDEIYEQNKDMFYRLMNLVLPEMNLGQYISNPINETIENQIGKTTKQKIKERAEIFNVSTFFEYLNQEFPKMNKEMLKEESNFFPKNLISKNNPSEKISISGLDYLECEHFTIPIFCLDFRKIKSDNNNLDSIWTTKYITFIKYQEKILIVLHQHDSYVYFIPYYCEDKNVPDLIKMVNYIKTIDCEQEFLDDFEEYLKNDFKKEFGQKTIFDEQMSEEYFFGDDFDDIINNVCDEILNKFIK